jgi:hypothetical protein
MVGNSKWDFPDRRIGDCSRQETIVRAWLPHKTDRGWRWLVKVRRVSTIEVTDIQFIGWLFDFFGLPSGDWVEVIKWESL